MMNNIEFIEEHHIYLLDGIITPSVSEILHFVFPDKYKGVPSSVLNKKANYGSKVHESIEVYEKYNSIYSIDKEKYTKEKLKLNVYQEIALGQYIELRHKYRIVPISQEQMINYKDYYCGRYDMVAKVGLRKCLCDIKTTAELDKNYLSWQLSMYELAIGKKFSKLYCIWLPKKELGQLVEVERTPKEKILKKLEEYREWKKKIEN